MELSDSTSKRPIPFLSEINFQLFAQFLGLFTLTSLYFLYCSNNACRMKGLKGPLSILITFFKQVLTTLQNMQSSTNLSSTIGSDEINTTSQLPQLCKSLTPLIT
jgi:hypothetical protein